MPKPDVAYLLDADPEAARARKPEYPVDFMRECRRAYKNLALLLGGLTIIPPLELEAAKLAVLARSSTKRCCAPRPNALRKCNRRRDQLDSRVPRSHRI